MSPYEIRISDWSSDGCSSDLQVLGDGRRSNAGQIVVDYLSSITADIGADVNPTAAPPLAVRHWFNPNLVYRWFIVPGLVGILAFFSALMLTSLSIARERELRSEEHTSELQSLMRISYAVFCLKKKNNTPHPTIHYHEKATSH